MSVLIKILIKRPLNLLLSLRDLFVRSTWQEESDRRRPQDIEALVFNLGAVNRASPIPTKINKPWPGHHAWGQSCRNNTAKVNKVLQQSNKATHSPNRLGSIKSLWILTRTCIPLTCIPLTCTTIQKNKQTKNIWNSHMYSAYWSLLCFQYGVVFHRIMREWVAMG